MTPVTPLEIVKRTPKTNCGECGFATCLAFAAAVATQGADAGRCPYLDRQGLDLGPAAAGPAADRDWALVEHLQRKVAGLDFAALAPRLGLVHLGGQRLQGRYLGQEAVIGAREVRIDGTPPEDPRDCILLYNYLAFGGGPAPSGRWIGMESMPNSISKVKTLATYCEEPLARLFSALDRQAAERGIAALDGRAVPGDGTDLACVVPVLPCLPVKLLFWRAEHEQGATVFDARVKILFDDTATAFLDIESLVFCAERLAERLAERSAERLAGQAAGPRAIQGREHPATRS